MKASELTGALLDLWVARALQLESIPGQPEGFFFWHDDTALHSGWFAPSTDWAHGGPLMDRFDIAFLRGAATGEICAFVGPVGASEFDEDWMIGPNRLTAGCRAIVASEYGDTVPDKAE